MQSKVYNQTGKEIGTVDLPESVFGLPWNADLVHQVVVSMQANARTPVAHTHDRGEQRGGGKKPWRQKGTGRARHGSRRSPLWRGGGVTHGPRNEKDYSKKINTKMRVKALHTVLSRKLKMNKIIFLDTLSFSNPKTKDAHDVLKTLAKIGSFEFMSKKKGNAIFISLPQKDENVAKSFRNLSNVSYGSARNLNPVDILSFKYLVITNPKETFSILEETRGVSKKSAPRMEGKKVVSKKQSKITAVKK